MAVAARISNQQARSALRQAPSRPCPPLENGARLTRAEFERRYEETPEHVKAELIEGVVYMSSPVSLPHGDATAQIACWLVVYQAATPGVRSSDNSTVRLGSKSDPQPDLHLRLLEGGTSRAGKPVMTPRGPMIYLEGAPELVAEVALSSASYDLHDKLHTYQHNGVKEYLVWKLVERKLEWFRLQDGKYVRVKPDRRGVIASTVFPGLRLHVKALLADRMADVLAELQKGLATPEHAAFVTQLAQRKSTPKKKSTGARRAKS